VLLINVHQIKKYVTYTMTQFFIVTLWLMPNKNAEPNGPGVFILNKEFLLRPSSDRINTQGSEPTGCWHPLPVLVSVKPALDHSS
jgi:hypothetical protein